MKSGKKTVENAKDLKERVEKINDLLKQKSFSWSELFYSLEKAIPRGVSIIDIKPSYKSKRININGVAKSLELVTALVDNLQNTKYIKKSFLAKEEKVLINEINEAVSFQIIAEGEF